MIALDTNVLIRYLVRDNAEQRERARRLIEQVCDENETIFICDIVLCELVWVLSTSRGYHLQRSEIARILKLLLNTKQFVFSDTDRIRNATDVYEHGKGDFADYLIGEIAATAGCEYVATFDRVLINEVEFREP